MRGCDLAPNGGRSAQHHTPFISLRIVEEVVAKNLAELAASVVVDPALTDDGRYVGERERACVLDSLEAADSIREDYVRVCHV